MDIRQWKNPDCAFRSAPFWSWNGEMKPELVAAQVRSMHKAGMGGFYMHSRSGLKTEYMGEEWMACIRACVEEARRLGMKANLYDEDRYSSGNHGGVIAKEDKDFVAKFLVIRKRCALEEDAMRLGTFHITIDDGDLVEYTQAEDGEYVFDVIYERPTPWYNFAPGTDVCNRRVAERLIELCYEPYYQQCGEDFGETIPYIFSDEVKVNWLENVAEWPENVIAAAYWSVNWREEFQEMWGYDLVSRLPELFYRYSGQAFSRVSMDYIQLMNHKLAENFFAPLGEWCTAHNIGLTGHLFLSGFRSVLQCGMVMQQLRHFGMPGVDTLTDTVHKVSAMRQVASVANQCGKKRVISEIYGCTGWDWPLAKHKFHGDWEYALGVNYRCPHLTHYTLAGWGKKDYPASISHHSPWWTYYPAIEDYFGRLSYALSEGKEVSDVLVLCPHESLMGYFDGLHRLDEGPTYAKAYEISDQWEAIVREMTDHHILFDFGDEELMEEMACVTSEGLRVGEMTYKTVVMLPCDTVRRSTLGLLERAGVPLLVMERYPSRVDGEESSEATARLTARENTRLCADTAELVSALAGRVSVHRDGMEATDVWCRLRRSAEGYTLFVAPNDFEAEGELTVSLAVPEALQVYRLDCADGQVYTVPATHAEGRTTFPFSLQKQGSGLFYIATSLPVTAEVEAVPRPIIGGDCPERFAYRLGEWNSRPLDMCTYRVGEGDFSPLRSTSQVEQELIDRYGLPRKEFYRYPQPWYFYREGVVDMTPREPVVMRFPFHVTAVPETVYLAWERNDRITVAVNGQPLPPADGTYIDAFIDKHHIRSLLREGENVVELSFTYQPDIELEPLYLLGDFGVYLRDPARETAVDNYTVDILPETLRPGELKGQGLDFYTGSVYYTIPNTPAVTGVRVDDPVCTCVALHAGEQTVVKAWGDYAFDTTAFAGVPELELELIFGRKNLFGPLHAEVREIAEPQYFDYGNVKWQEDYVLGLNSAGRIMLCR